VQQQLKQCLTSAHSAVVASLYHPAWGVRGVAAAQQQQQRVVVAPGEGHGPPPPATTSSSSGSSPARPQGSDRWVDPFLQLWC
jgi:hypothetical protein